MPTAQAAVIAFAVCVLAAALEGLCAGPGVRERFARIRQPRGAPPFAGWVVIGVAYYAICFTLLYRLFRAGLPSANHRVALGLLMLLLGLNAGWNYFFFRRRDFRASPVWNGPYLLVALGLALTLVRLGDGSVWVFVPYLIYLGYACWYVAGVWRLSRDAGAG